MLAVAPTALRRLRAPRHGQVQKVPKLRRTHCSQPGFTRRKFGRGFAYFTPDGARVTDPELVDRFNALVIPPAWKDVWICPWPNGHLQATGFDARGRRQYRYHDAWRQHRDRDKFDHMLEFARALPALRATCAEHLGAEDLTRERVLACATRLLDLGFFRIGSEGYAEENQTYGLATMRKRHVIVDGDVVTFDFTAKSGKRRIQSVVDADVAEVVRQLKARHGGGYELLAYQSADRRSGWADIKSADINAWIKTHSGIDCSAKDFRTWSATVLAAVALAVSAGVTSATGKKRAVNRAVKEVAGYLGNTPAVARSSYIDPRVIDRYLEGKTIADPVLDHLGEHAGAGALSTQGAVEAAVLDLLDERSGDETLAA